MGNLNDSDQYTPSGDKPLKLYCGIDVGSVNCGYAYSFENAEYVWVNKNWSEHLSYQSERAPSAILYDHSGKPVSFGFEACERFKTMTMEQRQQNRFFYDGLLDHQYAVSEETSSDTESDVVDETKATDTSDRTRLKLQPVLMRHRTDLAILLVKHCKEVLEAKCQCWKSAPDEMVWSFVVPAAWDIEDKKTFREIVQKWFQLEYPMEMVSHTFKIKVVPSTEALWVALCKRTPAQLDTKDKAVILVHAGDEGAEISLHNDIRGSIPVATKLVDLGGTNINRSFETHLAESLGPAGEEFLKQFKEKYQTDWLEFLFQFETAKKAFSLEKVTDISMCMYYSFVEAFSAITGKEFENVLVGNADIMGGNRLQLSCMGKLVLSHGFVQKLCLDFCNRLVTDINEVIHQADSCQIGAIVMTADLGEGAFVREYMRDAQKKKQFKDTEVYTHNSSALLLEGAVWSSKAITELPKTYALVYSDSQFESASDKATVRVHPVLSKGQEVEVGRCVRFGPMKLETFFNKNICFYICKVKKPMEVFTDGRFYLLSGLGEKKKIGSIRLTVPPDDQTRIHRVYFDITMDVSAFKTTMTLSTSKPRKKVSVMCPYK